MSQYGEARPIGGGTPMKALAWRIVAFIVSRRIIADYLIGRATRTPYFHLPGYMNRYWLFNRYSVVGSGSLIEPRFKWLPSIRIHHILRADNADHPHDHPWEARTIILRNGYREKRVVAMTSSGRPAYEHFDRKSGDTERVRFGEYHHIEEAHPLGAWTMFITWTYAGTWGFLVNGEKVPHWQYAEQHSERA